jgi:hypothetical protein
MVVPAKGAKKMIQKTFDFNDPAAIHREMKKQFDLMMPSFGHGPSPVMDSLLLAMANMMAAQNIEIEKYVQGIYDEMNKKFGNDVNSHIDDIHLDAHGNTVIKRTVKLNHAIDFVPISINIDMAACEHEWTEYTGMHEVFTYCKKCDKKQS